MDRIVVTGASGFLAKHVIGELLRAGYRVRGTVRNRATLRHIQAAMDVLAPGAEQRLEIVEADLLDDAGWAYAMDNADAVMHIASPVVAAEPKDPATVIRPAVEGTERVLRFAHAEHIRRIIVTASTATIAYGHPEEPGPKTYSEDDFTNLSAMHRASAYCIGKTRAEQAAWAFASGRGMQLTTIHPGAILGPVTDPETSASLGIVSGLLDGSISAIPNIGFAISDVRDVAAMHLAALQSPESIAQRYLCAGPYLSFHAIADILRAAFPDYPITAKTLPDQRVRLLARFGGAARQILNDLGVEKHFDSTKGQRLLGRPFRPPEDAILRAAESLLLLDLVKPPKAK